MYIEIDGILTITVNDWIDAGLTENQFRNDSKRGFLSIYRRGINGNTLIDVRSIKKYDRIKAIEAKFGKIEAEKKEYNIYKVEIDTEAREFFTSYTKEDGLPLDPKVIEEYVNRASIFKALKSGLAKQREARARHGKRILKGEYWENMTDWYQEQMADFPCKAITNPRSLERAFKDYLKNGYSSIIHKNSGNDAARKVSKSIEKLLLAIWRTHDKPFVNVVHERYLEFVSGNRELFDRENGEVFKPEDFRHKGRAMEISESTVWNYLKDVVNNTSVYADRNGNFDYSVSKRPKHYRSVGQYSLSKITMDDATLSRKSVRGWVNKYLAIDVVSGYWFRPAYIVGKPTINTVIECFRNMFCELIELELPMPAELEVENHLMKDISFLQDIFAFLRFCSSPVEKRAEHNIKSLKYGVAKKNDHTRGRWFARNEAYKSVRNKVKGDFVEPEFQPQTIVADDLADIEEHNNSLHPLQKKYPGMTRKEVFLKYYNPNLKPIEPYYLYKFIGNVTQTSIYNNDYCPVQGEEFELVDYNSLRRLRPNNTTVEAYWLPNENGSIEDVFLYQGETYIGMATNRKDRAYNECAVERTEADNANMLYQHKRIAGFDKMIREERRSIPKIATLNKELEESTERIKAEIVPQKQEEILYDNFEECEEVDYAAKAIYDI